MPQQRRKRDGDDDDDLQPAKKASIAVEPRRRMTPSRRRMTRSRRKGSKENKAVPTRPTSKAMEVGSNSEHGMESSESGSDDSDGSGPCFNRVHPNRASTNSQSIGSNSQDSCWLLPHVETWRIYPWTKNTMDWQYPEGYEPMDWDFLEGYEPMPWDTPYITLLGSLQRLATK